MLKKLLLALAAMIVTMGFAFAQVDVNKANQAELDSVNGIGPTKSKAIIEERKKGNFKDWADLQKRVKGIGDKNSVTMSQGGLTVNGQSKPGAPAAKESKKEAKKDAKADAKDAKKEAKAETKDTKKEMKSETKDAKDAKKDVKKEDSKK